MEIDNTTYEDLSLFNKEEEFSIFHKLDFTRTRGGKDTLLEYFSNPFSKPEPIRATQQIISLILARIDEWPVSISNGTIMVMERFYETQIDPIPHGQNLPAALGYKVFHGPDYAMVRYSVGHFGDFVRGMGQIAALLDVAECPAMLKTLLDKARHLLDEDILRQLAKLGAGSKPNPVEVTYFGHYIRHRFKT